MLSEWARGRRLLSVEGGQSVGARVSARESARVSATAIARHGGQGEKQIATREYYSHDMYAPSAHGTYQLILAHPYEFSVVSNAFEDSGMDETESRIQCCDINTLTSPPTHSRHRPR